MVILMNKAARKAVIAGNWKMNMTPSEASKLVSELIPLVENKNGCEIIICVPFVDILAFMSAVKGTNHKSRSAKCSFYEKRRLYRRNIR